MVELHNNWGNPYSEMAIVKLSINFNDNAIAL